jgi:uncharacterized OsmC-like protein
VVMRDLLFRRRGHAAPHRCTAYGELAVLAGCAPATAGPPAPPDPLVPHTASTGKPWTPPPCSPPWMPSSRHPRRPSSRFRAHNQWVSGTHKRSTTADHFGVGEERSHERTFVFDADHPAVLVGQDNGPTPVEFVLHALAACLTAGLANIAAARRVRLTEVRSTVTGDIDLNGILGLNPSLRNGYERITVRFTIKSDAPAHKLRELVEQSRARSAVYDIITNGVPVTIEVDTPDIRIGCHDSRGPGDRCQLGALARRTTGPSG